MAEITGDPRFEYLRRKASAQIGEEEQKQKAALQRRLAALGNAPGGAAIKAEQEIGVQAAKQRQAAEEEIGFQEIGEQQRRKEIEEARQYQTKEREAGQLFGAGEAEKQRGFTTAEREALQRFQAGESALGRKFTTEERQAGQLFAEQEAARLRKFTMDENTSQRQLQQTIADNNNRIQEAALALDERKFESAESFQEKQMKADKAERQFNALVAIAVQNDISIEAAAAESGVNLKKLYKNLGFKFSNKSAPKATPSPKTFSADGDGSSNSKDGPRITTWN